jgi:cell division protein ZapA
MGQIDVNLNGRSYTVACDDGQEEHLMELADYVARHADELAGSLGQVADSQLILMTSLMIADELGENLARIDALEKELEIVKTAKRPLATGQPASAVGGADTQADMRQLMEILDRATGRVQDIAARVAIA